MSEYQANIGLIVHPTNEIGSVNTERATRSVPSYSVTLTEEQSRAKRFVAGGKLMGYYLCENLRTVLNLIQRFCVC